MPYGDRVWCLLVDLCARLVSWRSNAVCRTERLGRRNANLEQILATDLAQLGQVPKLQALAMAVLRGRLARELDALVAATSKLARVPEDKGTYDTLSQRSVILDGSPTSGHPGDGLRGLDERLSSSACDLGQSALPDTVRRWRRRVLVMVTRFRRKTALLLHSGQA